MQQFLPDHETARAALDAMSIGMLLGWLVGVLPAVATGLTIIWTGLRIYETDTIQKWATRRKEPPDVPPLAP